MRYALAVTWRSEVLAPFAAQFAWLSLAIHRGSRLACAKGSSALLRYAAHPRSTPGTCTGPGSCCRTGPSIGWQRSSSGVHPAPGCTRPGTSVAPRPTIRYGRHPMGVARSASYPADSICRMEAHSSCSCWHCTSYDGLTAQGTAALCARSGCSRVRSAPHTGCSAWERAVGCDDEDGPPSGYRGQAMANWRAESANGWELNRQPPAPSADLEQVPPRRSRPTAAESALRHAPVERSEPCT